LPAQATLQEKNPYKKIKIEVLLAQTLCVNAHGLRWQLFGQENK
jgi:hypothetical protein